MELKGIDEIKEGREGTKDRITEWLSGWVGEWSIGYDWLVGWLGGRAGNRWSAGEYLGEEKSIVLVRTVGFGTMIKS